MAKLWEWLVSHRNESRDEKDVLKEIIRRLDDLERQRFTDCVCECCDLPKIWLSTSIRGGDSTWRSLDGDVRTLDPLVADHTADGGLMGYPNVATTWQLASLSQADLPAGEVEWIIDLSCRWTSKSPANGSYAWFADWNNTTFLAAPGTWAVGDPVNLAIADLFDEGPIIDGINLDPASAGITTEYGRGMIRVLRDTTTGATEVWLSGDGGLNWVTQGTGTFYTGQAFGGGILFDTWNELGADYPLYWDPYVIHATSVKVGAGGPENYGFSHQDLVDKFYTFTPNTQVLNGEQFGNAYLVTAFPYMAPSVHGSPLFVPQLDAGGATAQLFTDGAPLVDPAIVVSHYAEASKLVVVEGIQPTEWVGHNIRVPPALPQYSTIVWAVCDRASFDPADIDPVTNWPTGWWPFGTTVE